MSSPNTNEISDGSWISWFLGIMGNEFLCRVPTDFIADKFNLTGLEYCSQTLNVVLDSEFDSEDCDCDDEEKLYGMIHARYIVSPRGLEAMRLKYEREDFGLCPRVFCKGQKCLPVGLTDVWSQDHVKLYCPSCYDVFEPRSMSGMLDGAMFGTSFPHMFFMQMPSLRPHPPVEKYVPRLYGFKLHPKALLPPESEESPPNYIESTVNKSQVNTAKVFQE
ncbi:suppressor-of-stellate-like protein [Drosophila mauritiana]|uniref:Suppressor-of-stellate-like protein n=1 Tax=Drosophila mauritiana TaxID=7226 RepID=A0A6P8JT33_DROMA|nr:suppressor-of-stellate-like protein [Drosophila mauritiana]